MRALIIDCDGTLYQDLDFDNAYFEAICQNNSFDPKELHQLTQSILTGHYIKMNTCIALPNQKANNIMQLKQFLLNIRYVSIDDPEAFYLGDLWSVLTLIAFCIDVPASLRQEAFEKTRKQQEKYLMPNEALKNALALCRQKMKLCLLTNSGQDTAQRFIQKLELIDSFDYIVYAAQKPHQLIPNILLHNKNLLEDMSQLTIIGDHYYNDLMPFINSKAQLIWMNPYPLLQKPKVDIKELNSLDELINFLIDLAK